jgi:hypothetical protein
MNAYTTLDLGRFCNLDVEGFLALVDEADVSYPEIRPRRPPTGRVMLRGLPFQVGSAWSAGASFIALEPGVEPLVIPVGRTATEILFAHVILGSDVWRGAPVGRAFATYGFRLLGGSQGEAETVETVPIREHFEVGTLPVPWGQYPLLAVADRDDEPEPRWGGPWERIGFRRTEISAGTPASTFLWAWTNPGPARVVKDITIEPVRRGLVIAGISLGHLGEAPLRPRTRRSVRLTLPQPVPVSEAPSVEVDRGRATYPQPLPESAVDEGLPGYAGWGALGPIAARAWSVDVAALPSASLEVTGSGGTSTRLSWATLEASGRAESAGTRIELVDTGRNWVRTTVTDEATGLPVPCRIAFQTPDGVAWAPHGHHAPVFSGLPDWNGDIGGDVRLGQLTYAYIDGTCQGWLPRGPVIVDVARGFEWQPQRRRVVIEPGQTELRLAIARWSDLRSEGWYSGDTHVHFLSPQGALREAAGEDLHVVNLLQTQWGHLFTNTEDFTGGPLWSLDGERVVWVSQENRQHILGHLGLLGLRQPVMPWASGGPGEGELGGGLETALSHWADAAHAAGGTVVLAHFPTPNGEPAALVATGRADAAEMFDQLPYEHREYYRYLDAGYRLPLVAGTDKMSSGTPVGLYRTYAHIGQDTPFSHEAWTAALRAGRTFISSGPLLRFSVDGLPIGSTVTAPKGASLEVEGSVASIFPVHALQLVERGRVVDEVGSDGGHEVLRLRTRIRVEGATWLAIRAGGPGYGAVRHFDERRRGIMAHSGPVYVAPGGRYDLRDAAALSHMSTLIEGSLEHVRHASPRYPEGSVTHAHGEPDHQAYLERPFHEALAAVRAHAAGPFLDADGAGAA